MKTTAFLATAVSTLMLAAPALAQDSAPTGTPLGGPPQRTFAPPAPPEPAEQAAPETAAPEAAPAPTAAPAPAAASRPASKRRCSKKLSRAKYRKCRRAKARANKRGPLARKSAVWGIVGSALCQFTGDGVTFLYHGPPAVSSDTSQWIEYWNAYSLYMYSWTEPTEWVGPFYAHTDYPGWVAFNGTWRHESQIGSVSQHWVPSGGRAVGVQWINWRTTGEINYQYSPTDNCGGTSGYFGQ